MALQSAYEFILRLQNDSELRRRLSKTTGEDGEARRLAILKTLGFEFSAEELAAARKHLMCSLNPARPIPYAAPDQCSLPLLMVVDVIGGPESNKGAGAEGDA